MPIYSFYPYCSVSMSDIRLVEYVKLMRPTRPFWRRRGVEVTTAHGPLRRAGLARFLWMDLVRRSQV
jgi:hypothetical protein